MRNFNFWNCNQAVAGGVWAAMSDMPRSAPVHTLPHSDSIALALLAIGLRTFIFSIPRVKTAAAYLSTLSSSHQLLVAVAAIGTISTTQRHQQ